MKDTVKDTSIGASFGYAVSSLTRLRIEVLAGLVVGLALIPEAISFSIIVGVNPSVGLFTSVVMAVVIAFTGGRPAMISAATGAVALVIAPLSREYGIDYLAAGVLLAGVIQLILAALGVAKLMRFIPNSVMTGFVNALGVLLLVAQLPHLIDVPWMVYVLTGVGILIMIFFPKWTKAIPAPLVVIFVITLFVVIFDTNVPTVNDQGELPRTLPSLMVPDVPWTLETLKLLLPYSFGVAIVGLMESLMTAKLTDGITDTHSNKTRESFGQGIGNIATSLIGGMGGCAMIGQTMINVRESGARTRLSTLLAGVFLFIFIVMLGPVTGEIPMAALVAVMIMVSLGTIDWHSLNPKTLRRMPVSETIVMVVTVIATLITDNLAIGVICGVITAMIAFAQRVSHVVTVEKEAPGHYKVRGQLFFASSNDLLYQFDFTDESETITIDMSESEIWDASTVKALDGIIEKYDRKVTIKGLDERSKELLNRLRQQDVTAES